MNDFISSWLESLGLGQYAGVFAENDIDRDVLSELTDADLKELGISLGHRKKLLRSIAALAAADGAAPETVAERRQLTIMFCDLVNSTELSVRFDPEDLREIISSYQKCCERVVTGFGGSVARYMGDGLLVYFGYPVADEHDPELAIRAGLEIVRRVGLLDSHPGLRLMTRVGIATGEVVVGDLIGGGSAREHAVLGETPNLAARLQGLAEPDSVVVSDVTRRLAGGLFNYTDLGLHSLKGFAVPASVWRVESEAAIESRFEATHAADELSGIVGRSVEIEILTDLWQRARAGTGQAVLILGEPGIGKSRLVHELQDEAVGSEHVLSRHYCVTYRQNSALFPVIAQIERSAQIHGDDEPGVKLDKLEALVAGFADDPAAVVPLYAELLSIPGLDRYPPLGLSPERQKERTLTALVERLAAIAEDAPVLLVFEDLHWVDPTTLELLARIIDRIRDLPVLLLMNARPEFAPPWQDGGHVATIHLDRLSRTQVEAVVARVCGGRSLPPEVLEQIVAKTDGVPLFVEELTKTILESELLEATEDRYVLVGPLPDLAVPDTLQDSLMARLDRLAEAKEVAQIGAAIGRRFSYELLNAVADRQDEGLQRSLRRLTAAELVNCEGTAPNATYLFRHALIQDAAYSSLLRGKRQSLHRRIARVLESEFADAVSTQPELLAYHHTRAGADREAIPLWHEAGKQASHRAAHAEAIKHLNTALELIAGLADETERMRLELGVQVSLGVELEASLGYTAPQVERTYDRARELCHDLGMATEMVPVLLGLYVYRLVRADLAIACELAEQCVELSEESGRFDYLIESYNAHGHVLPMLGQLAESVPVLERCIGLSDARQGTDFAPITAQDPAVPSSGQLAVVLWMLGYPDRSLDRIARALALVQELEQPINFAVIHAYAAEVHQLRGEPEKAAEYAHKGMEIATAHGYDYWQALSAMHLGIAQGSLGDPEGGLAIARQSLIALRQAGAEANLSYFLGQMAAVEAEAGNAEAGLELIEEAQEFVRRSGERFFLPLLHCVRGDLSLATATPDLDAAAAEYRAAIGVAREQGARLFELRAAARLLSLRRDSGSESEASITLAGLLDAIGEGLDTSDVKAARALLAESGDPGEAAARPARAK